MLAIGQNMALKIEPSIQLHCFEPSLATFCQLTVSQWPDNVYLNNVGLGDAEGQLELNIVNPASGLNSLYLRHGVESARATNKEKIFVTTVDAYCEKRGIERIHFIKVDTEGHELSIFKGMGRMLADGRVNIIQFEYGGCNLDARVYLADIWEFLQPFGLKFFKLFPQGSREISAYSQSIETFKYSNWVARLTS